MSGYALCEMKSHMKTCMFQHWWMPIEILWLHFSIFNQKIFKNEGKDNVAISIFYWDCFDKTKFGKLKFQEVSLA